MQIDITEAMLSAAETVFDKEFNGTYSGRELVEKILHAAAAARPAPEAESVVVRLRLFSRCCDDGEFVAPKDRLFSEAADLIHSQAAAIAEREERIERLEKALWPFAEAAKRFGFPLPHPDETFIWAVNGGNPDEPRPRISVGDLVRARAALQQEGESDVTR